MKKLLLSLALGIVTSVVQAAPQAFFVELASVGNCHFYYVVIVEDGDTPHDTSDDITLGGDWITDCDPIGNNAPTGNPEPHASDYYSAQILSIEEIEVDHNGESFSCFRYLVSVQDDSGTELVRGSVFEDDCGLD